MPFWLGENHAIPVVSIFGKSILNKEFALILRHGICMNKKRENSIKVNTLALACNIDKYHNPNLTINQR